MGSKRRKKKQRPEVNVEELNELIDATTERALDEEESGKIRKALHLLTEHLDDLYRSSEKLNKIIDEVADQEFDGSPKETPLPKEPAPGHGRTKADAYTGAKTTTISHPELSPSCSCPECGKGKLSKQKPVPKSSDKDRGHAPYSSNLLRSGAASMQPVRRGLHGAHARGCQFEQI